MFLSLIVSGNICLILNTVYYQVTIIGTINDIYNTLLLYISIAHLIIQIITWYLSIINHCCIVFCLFYNGLILIIIWLMNQNKNNFVYLGAFLNR